MQRAVLHVLAFVVAGLVAPGCADGCASSDGPEATVVRLHAAVRAESWPAAHELVDYRHRLHEVLGAIWSEGSAAEQDALLALSRGMFEDTTRRWWSSRIGERAFTLDTRPEGEGVAWVDARVVDGPDEPQAHPFAWRYRLHRGAEGWRVTQREAIVKAAQADTSKFWTMVVDDLQRQLGRPPTLAEVTANVPSWQGRVRARVYTLPKGIGKR